MGLYKQVLPNLLNCYSKQLVTASLHLLTQIYYIQDDLFNATQRVRLVCVSFCLCVYAK